MASQDFYNDPRNMFAAMAQANPSLPTPSFPSLSQVRLLARQRANDIFADHEALARLLDIYEDILHKRWAKKSGEQRRKVLLKACPNIPAKHRPDFEALRRESIEQTRSNTRFYDSFLLPSINLEDLAKHNMLLLFVESRARQPPDVFANADFNSIHLGTICQAIVPSYLSGYTMLLLGQKTAATYGRLVSWDEDDNAFDMMSRGVGVQPGEGLLILEIQQRKLQFLRACVETILQDMPINDLTSVPVDPQPGKRGSATNTNDESERPSLSKEMLEAPYRTPDQFDFGRVQSFVLARRSEAEDHIWFLREDPAYFKDTILDWSEHRQEKILSINGKTHPALKQDIFWERVLGNVVVNAYTDLLAWDRLNQDVAQLVALRDQYSELISPTAELPEEFAQALCHFSYCLEQMTKGPISSFKVGMPASPPLRNHYAREPQDPNTTKIGVVAKSSHQSRNDDFLWLLERLLIDQQVFLCGLENLLDELERMLRNDPKCRDRMSSWLAKVVSDLALLAELKRQIGLLSPGPPMLEALDSKEKQKEFSKRMGLMTTVFTIFQKDMYLCGAGSPLTKVNYPIDKRRTAATTKTMQEAEKNLDNFWLKVDQHFMKHAGKTLHEMLKGLFPERPIQRTPDWKESEITVESRGGDTRDLAAQLSLADLEARSEQAIDAWRPPSITAKVKTRGTAAPPATDSPHGFEQTLVKEQLQKFTVSKRGFKVFATLFHNTTGEDTPGEVQWSEFLSAMVSVGFSVKKLDGSAWVFEPQNDMFRRSIIFHEPHPSNKIPFTTARRYGRRLERAYGWSSESFVRA